MNKQKIAFVGVGNMAGAMLAGIIQSGHAEWNRVYLYDKDITKTDRFVSLGAHIVDSVLEAVRSANVVVLSVKPQNFKEILPEIAEAKPTSEQLIITIAAGVTIQSITDVIGNVPVVRALPNTPMLIGKGVSALCANDLVSEEKFAFAKSVFDANGQTIVIPESEINRMISVTSSSPAYMFFIIQSMVEAAIGQGLPADGLLEAVCDTMIGSAELMKAKAHEMAPQQLIEMVTSKGGTTERAMQKLREYRLPDAFRDAMQACTDRADELGKS